MIDIQKAAVYCGTYKKYAAGNLAGGWLNLNQFATWQEFNEACKQLHKDEEEPEFMFQDKEYLPNEYYSESFIYPEIFHALTTLRNWSEKKLNDFQAYCEENTCIPEQFDVDEFSAAYKPKEAPKTDTDEELQEYRRLVNDEYLAKQAAAVIKIDEGKYYVFEKSLLELEKTFCWGYGTQGGFDSHQEALDACANFGEKEFKEENLKKFDKKTTKDLNYNIEYHTHPGQLCLAVNYYRDNVTEYYIKQGKFLEEKNEDDLLLSPEASQAFKEAYLNKVKELRNKFECKIDTYLKKYGVTKIRKWTYDADD